MARSTLDIATLVSSCCCAATILVAETAHADTAIARIEPTFATTMLVYHRDGFSRSPSGLGFGLGGAIHAYYRVFGAGLAYTGVPTGCTMVGLGNGPAAHFIDASASYASEDNLVAVDVGPSLAVIDRTFTNGQPSTTSSWFTPSSVEDVPLHATLGAHVGASIRVQAWDAFIAFGISYRGGAPIDVRDARYEGAFFLTLSFGVRVTLHRGA